MISNDILMAVAYAGIINAVVFGVIAAYSIFKLVLPIYHPFSLMLLYHLMGFILRPYYIYENGFSVQWRRIGFSPDIMDIVLSCIVSNVALVSAFAGFVLTTKTKGGRIPRAEPFHIESDNRPAFFALLAVIIGLGLYSNYRIFAGVGLDSVMAIKTEYDAMVGQRLVGVSGYTLAMAEFLPSVLLMLTMMPKFRTLALVLITAYIGLRVYAGAQRLSFIVLILGVISYSVVKARRRFPKFSFLLAAFFFLFIFNVIGGDRLAARRLLMGTASLSDVIATYEERRGNNGVTDDLAEFDVATATLSVVTENNAYAYGTQYLRLLIWPIPRQLWHDKPVYTTIVNLNDYGDFRYLTTGVYADTFMAFSFVSLVTMMTLLGVFFAKIYEVLLSSKSVTKMMFFWIVLIYAKTILRDGGVTIVYFWVFSIVPIVALSHIGKLRICR